MCRLVIIILRLLLLLLAQYRNSNLLNLLANDNRIVASDFLCAVLSVIECAVMFIRITMHGAVQTAAATLETYKIQIYI